MTVSEHTRLILVLVLGAVSLVRSRQAPVINLKPQLEAAVGTSARLECAAQGDPAPNVKFYRNNVLVQGQTAAVFLPTLPNYGGTRYIFTAQAGSGGPYECRATNGVADANGNTVITKVINVIITGVPSTTATAKPQTNSVSPQTNTPTPATTGTQATNPTSKRITTLTTSTKTPPTIPYRPTTAPTGTEKPSGAASIVNTLSYCITASILVILTRMV